MPLLENGLTIKQDKFVKKYIETEGNGAQSALAVYDTEDYGTARMIASDNLTKPNVRNALLKAFAEAKFGLKDGVDILTEKLQERDQSLPRYLQMYFELQDAFPDKKTETNTTHRIVLAQETIDAIANAARGAIKKASVMQTIDVKQVKKKKKLT